MQLALLSSFFWMNVNSQTFNNNYGIPGTSQQYLEAARSIEIVDDRIISLFHRYDSEIGTGKLWKYSFDLLGTLLDSNSFELDSASIEIWGYNGVNKTSENGLLATGVINDLIDNNNSYDSDFGAAILLDSNLDTIWVRRIGHITNYNETLQARQCANGDFIFVGMSDINNLNLDVLVARFDSEGNHLWTRNYGTQPGYEEWGWTIVETSEGDFIVGASVYQNINQPNTHLLMKIDEEGDLINYQIFGDWSMSIGWPKLEYCSDGNFIYCGSSYPSSSFDRDAYFCKIDSDLNIIWETQYPLAPELGYMFSIKENPDGSFISVGGGKKENGEDEGILVKLDAEGQMLWNRRYQHALDPFYVNYLYDVVPAPSGGYVASGTTLPVPQGQQIWLLKVDSMGCLVPGCDTLVSVFELEKNFVGFELYPNPASDVLNVYFESLSPHPDGVFTVYNLQGQAVHSFNATSSGITYILQVTDLPQGMYVLEYTDGAGVKMSKKWVKE